MIVVFECPWGATTVCVYTAGREIIFEAGYSKLCEIIPQRRRRTDGQTDRQTDRQCGITVASPRYA